MLKMHASHAITQCTSCLSLLFAVACRMLV